MGEHTDEVERRSASTPTASSDGQGIHRGFHPPERRGLSTTITYLLAEIANEDVTTVADRFRETVDAEALDALFSPRPDGRQRGPGSVEFGVNGYTIDVYSDGGIVIKEN